MKVLIVNAHPEPASLTSSLKDLAVTFLERAGHEVRVSDLHAMDWRAAIEAEDFGTSANSPLAIVTDSGDAYEGGTLAPEIAAEQAKLDWADTVILNFPLWWFHLPAIMKGWVDRVFTFKYAYGRGEGNSIRYGAGVFAGKRAMLSVMVGGGPHHYSERGINGELMDLLFPIHHGILYFPGFDVLPPFVVHDTVRMTDERFAEVAADWEKRLLELDTIAPIPFRPQAGGDYERHELKEGVEREGTRGLRLHVA
ncbi:dehydrogenase [Actinorhabdospora filicis]|uniref:Dehydrogenase n=1 Tax=Actinorhabdospora filicis TaxID=1785913 RepID=A0A9W6SRT5_9ACTN|nr:NAD(P)H-dependent oxidoreductase [Actinorhabdospora filicis]GLZ80790.1 dehydrogenase [Actinorhabdospora filicis]